MGVGSRADCTARRTKRRSAVVMLIAASVVAAHGTVESGASPDPAVTTSEAEAGAPANRDVAAVPDGSQAPSTEPSGSLGAPVGVFPTEPFVPGDGGERPELPARVAYADLGDAEIFTVWGDGVRSAAEARGLEYVTASAGFDPATNVDQIQGFLARGVGAMLVVELDAASQRPVMMQAMEAGVGVFAVPFGPSTTQMLTDQYVSGEVAATAMVDYIHEHLEGEGEILMFNLDDREGVRPRYQAVRDVVEAAGGGISIAVDQLGAPQTAELGFEVMSSVLQSNPEVRVVIGEDAHVLGALAALEAAGVADDPGWLLVGIGGEQQALEEVADPASPFRIDVSFALPTIGVLAGRFAADWLDGLAVPTVVTFNPIVLDSADAVGEFLADMEDPESLIDGPRRDAYLGMYGSISYATRMSYYDGSGTPANE